MKRKMLFIIGAVLLTGILVAQVPQAFKYQAVVRNINGTLIQNQQVAFRIGILQGGPADSLVYLERHTPNTNDYGLANLEIGKGTVLLGAFNNIDWSAGQMFMKVELDPAGGNTFINMGSFELLSVPYAMYADSSGSSFWNRTDNNLKYDAGSVSIGTGQPSPSAILELNSTDKGFLLPRMTSMQIANIQNPRGGLMVYSITNNNVYVFNDSLFAWSPLVWYIADIILPFCGIPIRDFRDFKTYLTRKIGTQCWFQENLNYGTMIDAPAPQTNNGIPEKYCWNNDPDNCAEYGGFYEWGEMMSYDTTSGARGKCPYGWHVPSDNDWCTLLTYVDPTVICSGSGWGGTDAGGKLKEAGFAHWLSPNTGATNEFGFTALGSGAYTIDSPPGFKGLTLSANFWSSDGYRKYIFTNIHATTDRQNEAPIPTSRLSVRCIRDN